VQFHSRLFNIKVGWNDRKQIRKLYQRSRTIHSPDLKAVGYLVTES
jgi:hypothetical protein